MLATATVSAQTALSPNESSSSAAIVSQDSGDGGASAQPAGWQQQSWRHDIKDHIAGEVGAGFNAPIGNDTPFITWGGNLTLGGGLHFTKRLSLLAEYQFMDDKLPGPMIAAVQTQGGYTHIWSFTLEPVVDLFPKRVNSIYLTGGGGFYRKVTSFTDPGWVEVCDFYCGVGVENVVVGHYSSNQGGVNVGFGVTHRIGDPAGDRRTQLFAEARYLFLNTPEYTPAFSSPVGTTELIPVTFGVRW